jgi:hypothetical protein
MDFEESFGVLYGWERDGGIPENRDSGVTNSRLSRQAHEVFIDATSY